MEMVEVSVVRARDTDVFGTSFGAKQAVADMRVRIGEYSACEIPVAAT